MSHYWKGRALFHFGQLVDARTRKLRYFSELQKLFNLPGQAFFSYLKICNFAHTLTNYLQFSKLTYFEQTCLVGSIQIYRIVIFLPPQTPIQTLIHE